jgi:hypothetical protein
MDAEPTLADNLRALEADLLRPEVRRSRPLLEALLAPDFVEIGRSGRHYDREAIVAALADADPAATRIEDHAVRMVAPGVALATWRSVTPTATGPVEARRASLWRREPGGSWRMFYHQGTPIPDPQHLEPGQAPAAGPSAEAD